MEKLSLSWELGYSDSAEQIPKEWITATVPGAVQQDYARAHNWEPFYKGVNFKDYAWMEDVYWLYRAPLRFCLEEEQQAALVFHGIDYKYAIRVDGEVLCQGEGMFRTIRCDVTRFAGKEAQLEVLIWPAPKATDKNNRSQARRSCKAAACYGWDWHPRLVTAGIWDDCYLLIEDKRSVTEFDLSYVVSDALDSCTLHAEMRTGSDTTLLLRVMDGEQEVARQLVQSSGGKAVCELTLLDPKLWYPVGWGRQDLYTVTVDSLDERGNAVAEKSRRVGFRRSKLVMNTGGWHIKGGYPLSRSNAPAQLEINGIRIFAKGSNWVNAQVFPGEMTAEHYKSLLTKVVDANMNIIRIWGGGFVNKESFFELCDELGVMVWQEFPLACNEYPDDPAYLSVLEQEATAIVRRLRTHPSVVMWCGGNELFNIWSGMTDQHHALRLLDAICYKEDQYTPYMMTSPLNGMAHGSYVSYDEQSKKEMLTLLAESENTAYTEFGQPSMSPKDILLSFMSEADYQDCRQENPVWLTHHGFRAWRTNTWVRKEEAEYYFGGYRDMDDLVEKTLFIQAMSYRSCFEEARRQWPLCAMALNWCFNEPWPTAANNSLLCWPDVPKPSYYAVQQALRPRMASLGLKRQLWWAGETLEAAIWLLNDSPEDWTPGNVKVFYRFGDGEEILWGTLNSAVLPKQTNSRCGALILPIPKDFAGMLHIRLQVEGYPEADSAYSYPCRIKNAPSTKGMLNVQ